MTKFLGLDWAPLNVPLERRLQTLAVGIYITLFVGGLFGWGLVFFLTGWTQYGWILVLGYALFRYWDYGRSSHGGRPIPFIRNCWVWRYFSAYFPVKLVKTAELDPTRNYLMGFHPHGILSMSCNAAITTDGCNWSEKFPGIRRSVCTLSQNFVHPFQRDLLMGLGMIEVSKDSIRNVLNDPQKGRACVIVIGGAQEALDARPGLFRLTLKARKGFAKMALATGADLVPILSFGENDLYQQVENPEGSRLRKFQEFWKALMGVSPPIFHGRGVFNYTAGIIPYRTPVHVVVGSPIKVEQTLEPTPEDVALLHERYIHGLTELFESQKTKFGVSGATHLEII